MKVLVIEDDDHVRQYIKNGLEQVGYVVDVVADGKSGLFMATTEKFDVIIVDRMLPELDGLRLLKTLRGSGDTTPVLILSALGEVDDRVQGLRAGGDDYLVKPFAFAELHARVEVLVRRSYQNTPNQSVLRAAHIELDLLSHKVTCDGKPVELQAREFRLLAYLLEHKGQVVTRTMLLEAVWDYHFDPQTNVIDVHISRLRKKIGDKGSKIIKTVRGAGYIVEDSL